jgi:hypothetical protein
VLILLRVVMIGFAKNVLREESGEEPCQEVNCGDGHANAEEYARQDSLRSAFTKSEGQSGDHNGDE